VRDGPIGRFADDRRGIEDEHRLAEVELARLLHLRVHLAACPCDVQAPADLG